MCSWGVAKNAKDVCIIGKINPNDLWLDPIFYFLYVSCLGAPVDTKCLLYLRNLVICTAVNLFGNSYPRGHRRDHYYSCPVAGGHTRGMWVIGCLVVVRGYHLRSEMVLCKTQRVQNRHRETTTNKMFLWLFICWKCPMRAALVNVIL